jgi:hypothetical protein
MNIDAEELTRLRHAAGLHDVGKGAIPDAIITKPTALDDEGVGLHAPAHAHRRAHHRRRPVARPRRQTRPRLPRGLRRQRLPRPARRCRDPLGARIIAVCDAFDAMISDRPCSQPKTTDQALAELRRCAGTQFDPAVVTVFEHVVADRATAPTATA